MFEEHLQSTIELLRANPIIIAVIVLAVVALFYFQPKETFKLLVFGLFLAAAFYIITLLVGTVDTGSTQKNEMIYKTRRQIDD